MRVIAKRNLIAFYEKHPDAEQPLKAWYAEASKASWKTPQDIKDCYASASFLENNRVVFNIKGNQYRLVVSIAYNFGAVYIKFIGTHREYDRTDAATIEMRH
ncbi:MAG: type II toxin-antitoxin system HigB family toxin [Oxalobacter sp.]|mgnify:CR=1 FL=1|nr:type II toxin-antitoxin system HigB family toxin [Oxalobacter sp.]